MTSPGRSPRWFWPLCLFIETRVDRGDSFHPLPSIGMLQGENFFERPVKVVSDVGYLLVEPIEGVAYDSPVCKTSTSNEWLQDGQVTATFIAPGSLIR
jgi:hypothetical protein